MRYDLDMEQTTPQQKKASFELYCIECDYSEHVSDLAEAGRLADAHDDSGFHETCIYDHVNDRMVTANARVAYEESLPEVI